MMKLLITGGTGFVGKTLVPYLYNNGFSDISLLVRNVDKANKLFPDLNISFIEIDDKNLWREDVIEYNPDVVIHLAALFNTKCDADNATNIINSNILFSTLLLEAVSNTNCQHFINIGTFAEFLYGKGECFANSLYAASKTAIRPIIQFYQTQSQFKWINVVLYTSYGRKNEHKKVLDYLVDAINSPTKVNFSKGEQIFDFIHVDDIADFFLTLLNKVNILNDKFIEFHLGTGKGHSLREVATIMERVFDGQISANWGGLPYRNNDVMYAVAPIAKNIELLNWRAKISLEKGLEILKDETLNNYHSL